MKRKEQAASHLYARLLQRDASAWNAMHELAMRAKAGDPKAMRAWSAVIANHLKANTHPPSLSAATTTAARRMHARLQGGDPAAWGALDDLMSRAANDDKRALGALDVLARIHAEQSSLASGTVQLAPARVQELVDMAKAARMSMFRPGGAYAALAPLFDTDGAAATGPQGRKPMSYTPYTIATAKTTNDAAAAAKAQLATPVIRTAKVTSPVAQRAKELLLQQLK